MGSHELYDEEEQINPLFPSSITTLVFLDMFSLLVILNSNNPSNIIKQQCVKNQKRTRKLTQLVVSGEVKLLLLTMKYTKLVSRINLSFTLYK